MSAVDEALLGARDRADDLHRTLLNINPEQLQTWEGALAVYQQLAQQASLLRERAVEPLLERVAVHPFKLTRDPSTLPQLLSTRLDKEHEDLREELHELASLETSRQCAGEAESGRSGASVPMSLEERERSAHTVSDRHNASISAAMAHLTSCIRAAAAAGSSSSSAVGVHSKVFEAKEPSSTTLVDSSSTAELLDVYFRGEAKVKSAANAKAKADVEAKAKAQAKAKIEAEVRAKQKKVADVSGATSISEDASLSKKRKKPDL